MDELDAELLRKLENAFVAIKLSEADSHQTGIRDELEAAETGRRGDVDPPPLHANTVAGGLDQRVGFCVGRAHTVTVLHQMPDFVAVREPANRAVVTGRE